MRLHTCRGHCGYCDIRSAERTSFCKMNVLFFNSWRIKNNLLILLFSRVASKQCEKLHKTCDNPARQKLTACQTPSGENVKACICFANISSWLPETSPNSCPDSDSCSRISFCVLQGEYGGMEQGGEGGEVRTSKIESYQSGFTFHMELHRWVMSHWLCEKMGGDSPFKKRRKLRKYLKKTAFYHLVSRGRQSWLQKD